MSTPNKSESTSTQISDDESWSDSSENESDDGYIVNISEIPTKIWNAIQYIKVSTKRNIFQFFKPTKYLQSRGLTLLDIEELLMLYPLSKKQFCVLMDEFLTLCGINVSDESQNDEIISTISLGQMMENEYLRYNPFKKRIRVIYKQDLKNVHPNNKFEDKITFFDFCKCLSVFAPDTPKATKIRFAFRIYDMEDDGFISRKNLFNVLKLVIGEKFNDVSIQSIVSDTFANCTVNSDGNIDYHEFHSIVGVSDIAANFTIHF
eukprot:348458_1